MVDVAQLVERWIVVPVVVGSSPIVHPSFESRDETGTAFGRIPGRRNAGPVPATS